MVLILFCDCLSKSGICGIPGVLEWIPGDNTSKKWSNELTFLRFKRFTSLKDAVEVMFSLYSTDNILGLWKNPLI